MKLIEKKCPNCGAGLKFDEDDKEVVCEYCKKSYVIERDKAEIEKNTSDNNDVDKRIVSEYYNLIQKKNDGIKAIASIFIVIFVFAVILFFSGALEVSRNFNKTFSDIVPVAPEKKDTYVTEIKQIDEKSLEIFHSESKSSLSKLNEFILSDVEKSEWTYVGMYLLTNKDEDAREFDKINELYDVYKKTFFGDDINLEVYATVRYTNLKLTDDNIVSNSYKGYVIAPMTFVKGSSYVQGYVSNEELYNKTIRSKSGDYNILSTDGLYVEN